MLQGKESRFRIDVTSQPANRSAIGTRMGEDFMPKETKDWTISGNAGDSKKRKSDGWGTLTNPDGRTIRFGTRIAIRGGTGAPCPVTTPCIIDLTKIEHGTVHDTKEATIPCFIAASDVIHHQLKAYKAAFIHCTNGNSRTSFCLIAYLIRHEGFSWKDASELVTAGQQERNDINFKLRTMGTQGSYAEWLESKSKDISLECTALSSYASTHVQASATSHEHKAVYEVCTNRPRSHQDRLKRMRQGDELPSSPMGPFPPPVPARTATPPPSLHSSTSSTRTPPPKRRKTNMERTVEEGNAFIDWYDSYRKRHRRK